MDKFDYCEESSRQMQRTDNRRILNLKSKRKKNLVKKAQELALLGNLQITVVIADIKKNIVQEFNSHDDFTVEYIARHKQQFQQLILAPDMHLKVDRKRYPQKNYIEQINMYDFGSAIKRLKEKLNKINCQHASKSLLDTSINQKKRQKMEKLYEVSSSSSSGDRSEFDHLNDASFDLSSRFPPIEERLETKETKNEEDIEKIQMLQSKLVSPPDLTKTPTSSLHTPSGPIAPTCGF